MLQRILSVGGAFLCVLSLSAQTLVSVKPLGSRTRSAIAEDFNQPLVAFDVQCYRLLYTTRNTAGQIDTVSGLVAIPVAPTHIFPRLLYQHGTALSKTDVPSFNVFTDEESKRAWLFAGLGFVTLMPDYLGLGEHKGSHPYVHAASEAWVAADMLRAFTTFAQIYSVHTHDQLFVTGYSQGGHASMAFHRYAESVWADEFTVTAAAHMSGPYSIGEVMRDLVLSDKVYMYPAYIPNTLIGYQGVYGDIYSSFQEVFRSQYIGNIADFESGKISLSDLQVRLVAQLIFHELLCRPTRLFRPEYLQTIVSAPQHPLNRALRDNNVYAWAPKAPTRLYYCSADDQVPAQNALLALDSMLARGAADLSAHDVKPNANHSQCAEPATHAAIAFFLTFRVIGHVVDTEHPTVEALMAQPNPTTGFFWLRELPGPGRLDVADLSGRLRHTAHVDTPGNYGLDLSTWENGLYFVRFYSEKGLWQGKVLLQR